MNFALSDTGVPDRNRTCNPQLRRLVLYPVELRAQSFCSTILMPLNTFKNLVGVEGFEPPTSCSQSRRATRLRYTPCRYRSSSEGSMIYIADLLVKHFHKYQQDQHIAPISLPHRAISEKMAALFPPPPDTDNATPSFMTAKIIDGTRIANQLKEHV